VEYREAQREQRCETDPRPPRSSSRARAHFWSLWHCGRPQRQLHRSATCNRSVPTLALPPILAPTATLPAKGARHARRSPASGRWSPASRP
jgi:hypothetical protein